MSCLSIPAACRIPELGRAAAPSAPVDVMSGKEPNRCAAFVRQFFAFLDREQVAAAVLHGWEEGFEGELSDIDFVVEDRVFPDLAPLVARHCRESGWRLCQVLRHETTAAFFVCSAADDPACVVALDACSSYQRRGTVFLRAADLLEGRVALPWGGHRVAPVMELNYRLVKAAAKAKRPEAVSGTLAAYPTGVRDESAAWLRAAFGITVSDWSEGEVARVLGELRSRTGWSPRFLGPRSLLRILRRVLRPTGLAVVLGDAPPSLAERFGDVFGGLYFRRVKEQDRTGPTAWPALARSTLVLGRSRGAGTGLLKRLGLAWEAGERPVESLAAFLEDRCARRENLDRPISCP